MDGIALIPLINEVEAYVARHGEDKPDRPYDHDNGMRGGDASSVRSRGVIRSLKRDGFEIKVCDRRISRSSGTYSVDWSEIDERTLEIYEGRNRVVEAQKCLGGERGWRGVGRDSKKSKVESTDWEIKEADSLDEIAQRLSKFKDPI